MPPPWVGQVLDHEARMGDETGKKAVYRRLRESIQPKESPARSEGKGLPVGTVPWPDVQAMVAIEPTRNLIRFVTVSDRSN